VDVLPADGMQEVRGSNPRSSTPRSSRFTWLYVHVLVWHSRGLGLGWAVSPGMVCCESARGPCAVLAGAAGLVEDARNRLGVPVVMSEGAGGLV
jgi:hypothetical protein